MRQFCETVEDHAFGADGRCVYCDKKEPRDYQPLAGYEDDDKETAKEKKERLNKPFEQDFN